MTWQAAQAKFGGDACTTRRPDGTYVPTAEVLAVDQDLAVLFANFQLRLNRDTNTDVALTQCNVRLPVDIVRGFYIGKLTQTLTFGLAKTRGVTVTGSASSTFFNQPVTTVTVGAGEDEEFDELTPALLTGTEEDLIGVAAFCRTPPRGNTLKGVYQTRFGIAARRSDRNASVDAQISAFDTRWDVEAAWFLCP